MSAVNPSQVLRAPHTVSVAPTETTLDSFTRAELRTAKRITVQVYHANAGQVFTGIVYVKQTGMTDFAIYDDTQLVAASTVSKIIVVDTGGFDLIEVRGTLSGAGGNVQTGTTRISNSP